MKSNPSQQRARIPIAVLGAALLRHGWTCVQCSVTGEAIYRPPVSIPQTARTVLRDDAPGVVHPERDAQVARVLMTLLAYHGPRAVARVWREARRAAPPSPP